MSFFYVAHRSYYMGERMLYAQRIAQAGQPGNADSLLSLVMDGMQQSHSELPYFGNRYTANNRLKQHLQGVTVHHHKSWIFRDFNFSKGIYTCIFYYTVLTTLHRWLESGYSHNAASIVASL